MTNTYVIETRELTKKFEEGFSILSMNLHVRRNSIYALLGRNGAGKTTVMKLLLGLLKPTSGNIYIFEKDFKGNEKKILPRIGCMIESPGFYSNLTGTENLEIFASLRGLPRQSAIQDALKVVGIPYKDKKLFSQYSLGMKQRLAIALAIMHDPELLILDEPINGLDPIGIAEVRSFIKELCEIRGKTILISSHILSEVALLADDIGIIDKGELIEEMSIKELEEKNEKYIHFIVSDAKQVALIFQVIFGINDFRIVDNHSIFLYDFSISSAKINSVLVQNNIEVYEMHLCENTLEAYFRKITRGEGIG